MIGIRYDVMLGPFIIEEGYRRMAFDIDRLRFDRLCDQFLQTPLFSKTFMPVMYVKFLQLDLDCKRPNPVLDRLVNLSEPERNKKQQHLAEEFRKVIEQENLECQNEASLIFIFVNSF